MKHRGSFPIGWTPLTDTTDKETNGRRDASPRLLRQWQQIDTVKIQVKMVKYYAYKKKYKKNNI